MSEYSEYLDKITCRECGAAVEVYQRTPSKRMIHREHKFCPMCGKHLEDSDPNPAIFNWVADEIIGLTKQVEVLSTEIKKLMAQPIVLEGESTKSMSLAIELSECRAEAERLTDKADEWKDAFIRMKQDWKRDCNLLIKLDDENQRLAAEVERLKQEKDAAVADLTEAGYCFTCKKNTPELCPFQVDTDIESNTFPWDWNVDAKSAECYEWRGKGEEDEK